MRHGPSNRNMDVINSNHRYIKQWNQRETVENISLILVFDIIFKQDTRRCFPFKESCFPYNKHFLHNFTLTISSKTDSTATIESNESKKNKGTYHIRHQTADSIIKSIIFQRFTNNFRRYL